jgi:AICAR transformylase/IMP cyclohydrolase PurH
MATNAELLTQLGATMAPALTIYGPALARMAGEEFTAWKALVDQLDYDAAKHALHSRMTLDEMAAEKEALTPMFQAMVERHYANVQTLKDAGLMVLKALASVVLTAML